MATDSGGAISVVITAYNCARYLGQAIESVLGQSRPAQQVIVVDDGSTDDCAAVAGAYASRVQYVYQANSSSGGARNAGARLATGDWLALLDGDDYWTPDKLALQMAAARAGAAEILFGHIQNFISPDLPPEEAARLRPPAEPLAGYCATTMLAQHAAFWRVGEFVPELPISEFVQWYGRAMEARLRVQLLPGMLAWRRIHANNSTRRNRDARGEYARVLKSMLDRRRANPPADGV
jgi:glycosyltransferase involved in cell wall biosynthesis